MSTDFIASGGVIDQSRMSLDERRGVSRALRDCWWDCYRVFDREMVEVNALGLLPASLRALADDLADAGYVTHADVVRRAAATARPTGEGPAPWPLRSWRPRTHSGVAARR